MPTKSKNHDIIGHILEGIIDCSKSWEDLKKNIRANRIHFEEVILASGPELLVYTGSSGYDIVGYSIMLNEDEVSIKEM